MKTLRFIQREFRLKIIFLDILSDGNEITNNKPIERKDVSVYKATLERPQYAFLKKMFHFLRALVFRESFYIFHRNSFRSWKNL